MRMSRFGEAQIIRLLNQFNQVTNSLTQRLAVPRVPNDIRILPWVLDAR